MTLDSDSRKYQGFRLSDSCVVTWICYIEYILTELFFYLLEVTYRLKPYYTIAPLEWKNLDKYG